MCCHEYRGSIKALTFYCDQLRHLLATIEMPNIYDEVVRLPVRKFLQRILTLRSCISNVPFNPDHGRLYEDINLLAVFDSLGHGYPLLGVGGAPRQQHRQQNLGRVVRSHGLNIGVCRRASTTHLLVASLLHTADGRFAATIS
jgi:hypothetical protein